MDVTEHRLELEVAKLRQLLVSAALSILSYHHSYGMGSGDKEAIDIAVELGYDGPQGTDEVSEWLIKQLLVAAG